MISPYFFLALISVITLNIATELFLYSSGLWLSRWAPDLSIGIWWLGLWVSISPLPSYRERWQLGAGIAILASLAFATFVFWFYAFYQPDSFHAYLQHYLNELGLDYGPAEVIQSLRRFWFSLQHWTLNFVVYLITGLIIAWIGGLFPLPIKPYHQEPANYTS